MQFITNQIRRGLLVALVGALGACAGNLDNPDRFLGGGGDDGGGEVDADTPVDCSTIEATIIESCGADICHGGDAPSAGLDFASAGFVGRMSDVASTCNDRPVIDSANVDNSYLLNKLTDDAECGSPMPLGQDALSAAELDCLKEYIAEELQ